MEIKLHNVKELEGGGCIAEVEYDQEGLEMLLNYAVVNILKEKLEEHEEELTPDCGSWKEMTKFFV